MRAGWAQRLAAILEEADWLDRIGAPLNDAVLGILRPGRVRDWLSGTGMGHPAHPSLVAVPIGCWVSGLLADASGEDRMARRLIGLGVIAAVPAAATGMSDWADTDGAERRVGVVHLASNLLAAGLFGWSWYLRRDGRSSAATALSVVAMAGVGAGGWLGGHLAYSLGVGVDTNAFEAGPTDWQPVDEGPESQDGVLAAGQAGGIGLVIARPGAGQVAVLADRCSHRGGPLHEGDIVGDCIRCPWHDSQFEISSGRVVHGPATVTQPVYETRLVSARLEVRRPEARALRNNSVKPSPT